MSNHKTPLTPLEESGLRAHRLPIGKPSQLSDVFRQGIKWALRAQTERDEVDCCVCGEEQQHRLQSVFQLRDRLESSKAPPPKSEPL